MTSTLKRILLKNKLELNSDSDLANYCGISLEELIERVPEEGNESDIIREQIKREDKKLHPPRVEPISMSLRFEILTRDNFRCRYCGRGAEDNARLQVDHIVSVKQGGHTIKTNLITACLECNIGKGGRSLVSNKGQISSFLLVGK